MSSACWAGEPTTWSALAQLNKECSYEELLRITISPKKGSTQNSHEFLTAPRRELLWTTMRYELLVTHIEFLWSTMKSYEFFGIPTNPIGIPWNCCQLQGALAGELGTRSSLRQRSLSGALPPIFAQALSGRPPHNYFLINLRGRSKLWFSLGF